ncbi:hypothetical protein JIX56_46935 [Streptomyces sp. CA-210063]|uniref:hypothetical protein n=1 Tax=Streptomyces sp. CA-210063 TaxID=2801029 RepID=UPI00214AFCBB|nr:hypothetical protein [Streptomyces sp. CA-210063]UUU36742.1 hypothetical protein JIX56_46935 [Streptomyces sp. CA-210063]
MQSASDLNAPRRKATSLANAVHQLFGLVAHAADPGNVNLSDQPELAADIAALYRQAEHHTRSPRTARPENAGGSSNR